MSAEKHELTAGLNWYASAYRFASQLSIESGLPLVKVCGIIAALSPIKSWNENVKIARMFCLTGKHYHTNICGNKAIAIRDLPISDNLVNDIETILNGNKIRSFFHNIYYHTSSPKVTLDRHALRIAKHGKDVATQREYERISKMYLRATKKINEITGETYLPLQVQAVTWVKIRRQNSETTQISLAI